MYMAVIIGFGSLQMPAALKDCGLLPGVTHPLTKARPIDVLEGPIAIRQGGIKFRILPPNGEYIKPLCEIGCSGFYIQVCLLDMDFL